MTRDILVWTIWVCAVVGGLVWLGFIGVAG